MFIQGFLDGANAKPAVLEVIPLGTKATNFHLRITEAEQPNMAQLPIGHFNFNLDAAARLRDYLTEYLEPTR